MCCYLSAHTTPPQHHCVAQFIHQMCVIILLTCNPLSDIVEILMLSSLHDIECTLGLTTKPPLVTSIIAIIKICSGHHMGNDMHAQLQALQWQLQEQKMLLISSPMYDIFLLFMSDILSCSSRRRMDCEWNEGIISFSFYTFIGVHHHFVLTNSLLLSRQFLCSHVALLLMFLFVCVNCSLQPNFVPMHQTFASVYKCNTHGKNASSWRCSNKFKVLSCTRAKFLLWLDKRKATKGKATRS